MTQQEMPTASYDCTVNS